MQYRQIVQHKDCKLISSLPFQNELKKWFYPQESTADTYHRFFLQWQLSKKSWIPAIRKDLQLYLLRVLLSLHLTGNICISSCRFMYVHFEITERHTFAKRIIGYIYVVFLKNVRIIMDDWKNEEVLYGSKLMRVISGIKICNRV